jgi:hypothetical protein
MSEEYVNAALIHGSREKRRNFFADGIHRLVSESESELLYDWRLTAHHFALAAGLLRLTSSIFFN